MPTWTTVDYLLGMERRANQRQRDFERWVEREELVDLVAARCYRAYQLLGGKSMSVQAWRARARELLSGGIT
jgi:hypothetical protein